MIGESQMWAEVAKVEGGFWPQARDKAPFAVLDDKLYLYGGFGPADSSPSEVGMANWPLSNM